jgi:DNA-binding CsgD family transcriptional regulator
MRVTASVIFETESLPGDQTKINLINTGTLKYPMNIFVPMAEKKLPKNMDESLSTLKNIHHTLTGNKNFLLRNKATIIYSISLACLLFLLKWLELRFTIYNHSFEIYIGFIAIIFTALGIWLAVKLSEPKIKTVVIEKEVYVNRNEDFVLNTSLISQLELSKRELEILALLAQGHSNQEIASKLFVSLSTVKSHIQNLFEKLDVKRRIQAIEKARNLNLIP